MRQLRSYRAEDAADLAEIFHRAVHDGAAKAYSKAERNAWSPALPEGTAWAKRLDGLETVVAEEDGTIVGFMSLDLKSGYLDLAFVLPERARSGIATALYAMIEGRARAGELSRLTTEASLIAEPFFVGQGWQVLRRQTVKRNGESLKNAVMEKQLAKQEVAA